MSENDFPGLSDAMITEILKRTLGGEEAEAIVSDVGPRTDASEATVREFIATCQGARKGIAEGIDAGVQAGVKRATRTQVSSGVDRAVERLRAGGDTQTGPWSGVILLVLGAMLTVGGISEIGSREAGLAASMLSFSTSLLLYGLRLRFYRSYA